MSQLQAQINVVEISPSIAYVYDCTGQYSSDNTGGFGGLNPKISDVNKAILYVTTPGSKTPVAITLTDNLPNTDEVPVELTPQMCGLSTSYFPSGKYTFQMDYEVNDKGSMETKSAHFTTVFIKDIECCLDPKTSQVSNNSHLDERSQEIIANHNLFEVAKIEIEKGLYDSADKRIEYLNGQCKCSTC